MRKSGKIVLGVVLGVTAVVVLFKILQKKDYATPINVYEDDDYDDFLEDVDYDLDE